jgi:hypothetical protein
MTVTVPGVSAIQAEYKRSLTQSTLTARHPTVPDMNRVPPKLESP